MLEHFIQEFGYYAVFVFACVEGEIAVLTAGFLCNQGLMSLNMVVAFAFLGTMMTEQILYFVGRLYGTELLQKHPKWQEKSQKVIEFLRRYDSAFIFGCRFIYGIRNISPIMIGVAGIPPLKYSMLNIPAAFTWAVLVAGAGYLFADMLETAKDNLQYVQYAALGILLFGLCYFVYKKNQNRNKKKNQN